MTSPPCWLTRSRHWRAIARRTRQLSWAGMAVGLSGMLSPYRISTGILVRLMNCAIATGSPFRVSNALGMGAGNACSGKRKPLPGSNATMAFTLLLFMAVCQPGPPP
ncbi:hypothetical protein D3C85_1282350 [compost metagenome]